MLQSPLLLSSVVDFLILPNQRILVLDFDVHVLEDGVLHLASSQIALDRDFELHVLVWVILGWNVGLDFQNDLASRFALFSSSTICLDSPS